MLFLASPPGISLFCKIDLILIFLSLFFDVANSEILLQFPENEAFFDLLTLTLLFQQDRIMLFLNCI